MERLEKRVRDMLRKVQTRIEYVVNFTWNYEELDWVVNEIRRRIEDSRVIGGVDVTRLKVEEAGHGTLMGTGQSDLSVSIMVWVEGQIDTETVGVMQADFIGIIKDIVGANVEMSANSYVGKRIKVVPDDAIIKSLAAEGLIEKNVDGKIVKQKFGSFDACVEYMKGRPDVRNPEGLCAYIAREVAGKRVDRIDRRVEGLLKQVGKVSITGTLIGECEANDGTKYPDGTEVKFAGRSTNALMRQIDDEGMVSVILPNGEHRNLEPDSVDFALGF